MAVGRHLGKKIKWPYRICNIRPIHPVSAFGMEFPWSADAMVLQCFQCRWTMRDEYIRFNQYHSNLSYTTIVKPQLYNTRQYKTITVTKQHSNYIITTSEMRYAARKLPVIYPVFCRLDYNYDLLVEEVLLLVKHGVWGCVKS